MTDPVARKKLCILLPSHWSSNFGGAESQVEMLLRRLVELNRFELHYATRRFDQHYKPTGYALHKIPTYRTIYGSFILDSHALYRLLRHLKPDVIYQRVACTYTGVAAFYAKRAGCRFIWHVSSDRDLTPSPWAFTFRSAVERINKSLVKYGGRVADKVIVQNAEQAEHLHQHFERTDTIRIANFHPLPDVIPPKSEERLLVCWIGNIKELKQPEIFLRLAGDLRMYRNVDFVMVGARQMPEKPWRRFSDKLNGLANLQYIGHQPPNRVEEILTEAHALVNTSSVEGFPNTFIQAWLREVPVVSFSVNPDGVFTGGKYGFCAAGDYNRLKSALIQILTDASLRKTLGSASRLFARTQFSERNMDRIISVLSS